jgi:hypothetical protein
MAITSAFWNFIDGDFEGYDIHLLTGETSRTLNDLLKIKDGVEPTATFKLASEDGGHPFGTTTRFLGEFSGAPGPAHGVEDVDVTTGEVEISISLPTTRLFNFLVRAEVSLGTPPSAPVFSMTPRIRVHIHSSVVRAWLSPIPLSIHRGSPGQRFSVLAEFDDGVIGDISRLPGIAWSIPNVASNTNPDGTLKFTVDPTTGALAANVDSGNVTVQATLPPRWLSLTPSAGLNALPPWSTPRAATLVAGPGAAARHDVMNYLFLPEGFAAGEETKFTKMVQQVVTALRKDGGWLAPYDLLKKSINYWMAFVESRHQGASVLFEVNERPDGTGRRRWIGTPPALKPADPPAPPTPAPLWRGDEVFHEVGLPVLADVIPPGTPGGTITAKFNAQMTRWTTLYGSKVTGRIDQAGFENWCSWGDRRLVDENDTALGLAVGNRPRREYNNAQHTGKWYGRRTQRADLDGMLKNLTDGPTGPKIGDVWGDPNGKDRRFVCALLGGTKYVAVSVGDLVSISVIPQDDVLVRVSGPRALAIEPFPLPDPLAPAVAWTIAHETGHLIGLGDEYAGPGTFGADGVPGLVPVPNLQDLVSLSNAPPPPPAAQVRPLDGSKLKWVWHRIAKAGVLTGNPTPDGAGKFKLPVKAKHVALFKADDEVLIRLRALAPATATSVRLKVTGTDAGILKVTSLGGTGQSPTAFPAESVVYVPVKGSDGKPLLFVSEKIRTHLTTSGQPLNAPTGAAKTRPCDPTKPISGYAPGTNLPSGITLKAGMHKGWIVGAYEGGIGTQCGIYHPTGACMMNENRGEQDPTDPHVSSTDPRVDYLVRDKAYVFCPVCRYVIVDAIDPTRHKALDDWYRGSGRYGE